MRHCLNPECNKILTRHDNEKRAQFLKRKYCTWACSIADRPRVNAEKRALLDLKDLEDPAMSAGLTFTEKEILHRAHMTAPQIPITVLDSVIRDIKPMLAANTRHQMLTPLAAKVRAMR